MELERSRIGALWTAFFFWGVKLVERSESGRQEEERRGAEVVNCRLECAVAAEGARRRRGRQRVRSAGRRRRRRRRFALAPTDVFSIGVHGIAPKIPVPHRSVQGSRTAAVQSLPSL